MKVVLKRILKEIKDFVLKYKYLILLALPFFIMDLATRYFGRKIGFFALDRLVPNLFTVIWIMLFLTISLSFKKKYGKD